MLLYSNGRWFVMRHVIYTYSSPNRLYSLSCTRPKCHHISLQHICQSNVWHASTNALTPFHDPFFSIHALKYFMADKTTVDSTYTVCPNLYNKVEWFYFFPECPHSTSQTGLDNDTTHHSLEICHFPTLCALMQESNSIWYKYNKGYFGTSERCVTSMIIIIVTSWKITNPNSVTPSLSTDLETLK